MAKWHNGYQVWLTEAQSLENAQLVANRALKKGWVKMAICGMLGNMRHESSVNPNMYEFGMSWGADRGFGLVQWTPRSKYWNWALQKGYKESELRDGEAQMDRIDWEAKNGEQWMIHPNFGETFAQFRKNKNNWNISQATESFARGYERPLESALIQSLPERIAFAKKCYDNLDFSGGSSGGDDDDDDGGSSGGDGGSSGGDGSSGVGDSALEIIKKAFDKLVNSIEDALTWDLHSIGTEKFFSNSFFAMQKTFNNTYRIQMNVKLLDQIKDLVDGIDAGGSSGGGDDDDDGGSSGGGTKAEYNLKNIRYTNDSHLNYPFDPDGTNPNYPFPRPHLGVDIDFYNENLTSPVVGTTYTITDPAPSWQGGTGYGNHIIIDSPDGYQYLFGHLNSFKVKTGDKVKVGDLIAITNNTGDSTGPHLHFEIRKGANKDKSYGGTGKVQDPAVWRAMVKRKTK